METERNRIIKVGAEPQGVPIRMRLPVRRTQTGYSPSVSTNMLLLLIALMAAAAFPAQSFAQALPPESIAPKTGPEYAPAGFDIGNPFPESPSPAVPKDSVTITPDQQELINRANAGEGDTSDTYDENGNLVPSADNSRTTAKAEAPVPTNGSDGSCSIKQTFTSPIVCALSWMANTMMGVSARVLWMAGILLNKSISVTINMKGLLDNLPIVDIGWKILRDISNIVFIFITLWCGISITLGIGDNGSKAWGLLAHMVLVALFINFSLFITKAVIDVSNIAAIHFYSLIQAPDHANDYDGGLSDAFMNGLQVQSLYNSSAAQSANGSGTSNFVNDSAKAGVGALSYSSIILIGIFGSITILVAAFVFFAAAIMFIIRAITLIMLMVLSPLAFVAWILPGASGLASTWWSKLWSQSFFAPLYLALAYVVVSAINSDGFKILGGSAGSAAPSFAAAFVGVSGANMSIIFNFIIIIGLLIGCLIVAQSLGAKGSDTMMAWGGKLKTTVGGAAVRGAIKLPARLTEKTGGTIGKASKWMASTRLLKGTGVGNALDKFGAGAKKVGEQGKWLDPRYLEERASKSKWGNTYLGSVARSVTTGAVANAQFGNKSLEEAYKEDKHRESAKTAVEARNHAVHGADTAADARKKLDAARADAEGLEATKAALEKAGGAQAVIDRNTAGTASEDDKKLYAAAQKDASGAFARELEDSKQAVRDWEKALADAKGKISEALGHMSTQEFVHLMPRELLTNPELMNINVLGADKWNAVKESEDFSEEEKKDYAHARYGDVLKESQEYRKGYTAWQQQQVEYQKKLDAQNAKKKEAADEMTPWLKTTPHEKELRRLKPLLKQDMDDLAEAEKLLAEATTDAEEQHAQQMIVEAQARLDDPNGAKAKTAENQAAIDEKRIEVETAKGLRYADGPKKGEEIKIPPPAEPQSWKDKDVYRGLRNMRNVSELEGIARFMPELLNEGRFVSTLSQSMVDNFRISTQVGSAQKTQVRTNKSYYMTEANDLILGLDPEKMRLLDRDKPSEAQQIRNERNDLASKDIQKFQDTYLSKVDVSGKVIVDASGKPVRDEEAWARHETGERLMPLMVGHKADDEITKMPGIQRNLYGVRKHMGRASTKRFAERDEGDDKRPLVAFMLDQLKQAIEGQGEITTENIEALKWMVNDRDGKNFANYGLLEEKHKKLMEIAKAIYGTGNQALQSQWSKKQALEEMHRLRKEMEQRTGRHAEELDYGTARSSLNIEGDEGDYA